MRTLPPTLLLLLASVVWGSCGPGIQGRGVYGPPADGAARAEREHTVDLQAGSFEVRVDSNVGIRVHAEDVQNPAQRLCDVRSTTREQGGQEAKCTGELAAPAQVRVVVETSLCSMAYVVSVSQSATEVLRTDEQYVEVGATEPPGSTADAGGL